MPYDTDRNLLFGVLALQAGLIDNDQLGKAGALWATTKDRPLADVLREQGWLTADDCQLVDSLLERNLQKHGGNVQASLAEAATSSARQALGDIADPVIQASLHAVAEASTIQPRVIGDPALPPTLAYQPAVRRHYTLTRLHASGGIGQVWLARDEALGREVALKEIQPDRADNPAVAARFLEEARIAAQLQHPGIIPVYELCPGSPERPAFYTMKFIRGRTLADACKQYHRRREAGEAGPLELRGLLGAFVTVCQAVGYAHSRGVIHRDLKPANVALGDYGEVLVLDFGLSKLMADGPAAPGPDPPPASLLPVSLPEDASRGQTIHGQVLGTPAYMAPEQAEGRLDQVDSRSDVYGLGAILYEVLTGEPPFSGADVPAILAQVALDSPVPPRRRVPSVPAALEAVCLKALAKRRSERYASATELAAEMQRFLADEPVQAFPEPWTMKTRRWLGRHRTTVATVAAALLVATVGLGIGALLLAAAGDRERAKAQEAREAKAAAEAAGGREKAKAKEAREAKLAAEDQRDQARRLAYATGIGLAQRAYDEGNVDRARALLHELPTEARGQDLRGFEWHYLSGLCSQAPSLTLRLKASGYSGLAFSSDGRRLFASGINQAAAWDTATGKALFVSPVTVDLCSSAFSPDGRRVAEGYRGGTIRIRDVATGKEIFSRKFHGAWAKHLAFSPDGSALASSGSNGTIEICDSSSGQPLVRPISDCPPSDGAENPRLAFSPEGRLFAVGGTRKVSVRAAATGAVLWEREWATNQPGITFNPDGHTLAVGGWDAVRVWDARAGKERFTVKCSNNGRPMAMAFSPDGKRLVVGGGTGTVEVWDTATCTEVWSHATHAGGAIHAVAVSPDGRRIASGGFGLTVEVWDAATGAVLFRCKDNPHNTVRLTFSPDGRWLAMGLQDGTVNVWDTAARENPFILRRSATTLAFSADGQGLISAGQGKVTRWDVLTGRALHEWDRAIGILETLSLSPGSKLFAWAGSDGTIQIHESTTGKLLRSIKTPAGPVPTFKPISTNVLDFSLDGRYLAGGLDDRTVRAWDVHTGRELSRFGCWAVSVALSPDGRHVAAGSWGGEMRICNTATGQTEWFDRGGNGPVYCVAFSPDGRRVAAGYHGRDVTVWDASTRKPLYFTKAHANSVWSLAFSPDGRRLASADILGTVKIWDADKGQELLVFQAGRGSDRTYPRCMAFSPDGQRLAVSGNGAISLWDTEVTTSVREQRAATWLVADLFIELQFRYAVLERLRTTPAIDEHIRKYALAAAEVHAADDPIKLGVVSWNLAKAPNRSESDYRLALRYINEACRLQPNDGDLINTVGVAYYRLGDYKRALEQLRRSDKLDTIKYHGAIPADLAFLAMAEYRLGHMPAAASYLERLHERLKDARWAKDAEALGFLHEAEQDAADREIAAGRTQNALVHLATLSETKPNDTGLFLEVAALQAWFGEDKELGDTCRRGLAAAKNTTVPETADRVAKACCLRSSADKARLEAALTLARKAVRLGKGGPLLPWFQMDLGAAEYRAGHFAEAEAALSAAGNADTHNLFVAGTSAFYRAMSLFRQGKEGEARKLAAAAAAMMRPFPKDEKNPLAGNPSPDDLILWLAYKEAKTMIKLDAASPLKAGKKEK